MRRFPVMDRPTPEERRAIGFVGRFFGPMVSVGVPARGISAVRIGEFRCPKAGEWYLSGAIIEAYRAPNDLSTPYHIARLVLDPERSRGVKGELSVFRRGIPGPVGEREKIHKVVLPGGMRHEHAVCLNGAYHCWFTDQDSEVTCRACLHVMNGGKPGEVTP